MLIFIHGEDFQKKKIKIKNILDSLKKQRPSALFLHFDFLDLTVEKLKELIQTAGLLEEKNIILLTNIFQNTEVKKFFLDNLEALQNSNNAFLLSEEKLDNRLITKIQKIALKVYSFPLLTKKLDVFKISTLLEKKDIKQLWLFYHQALQDNISAENIFGIIIWSLKQLILKNKKTTNWTKPEIENKIFQAVKLFHQVRFNNLNFKNSLEKFILDL